MENVSAGLRDLLLMGAIIFVLTTVVVPFEGYHFLEQKEAEQLINYFGLSSTEARSRPLASFE
jgi:hypothetical protein